MKIEQIYTGCLAHGAYYIESGGEAAIVDPLREVQPYLDRAERNGTRIKYVLETHFHADFVSGHLDLVAATGAEVVYGPTARPAFPAHVAADGEELKLGQIRIRVVHTPGHTMESACFLVIDESGKPVACFTGDTLFIGDVGRPDLAQKAANLTQEELAGLLYDSLRNKIMTLPDYVVIYPGHGAGSACGKNMSSETEDTLGRQKKLNYALRTDMTREEFIREVTDGLMPPPGYFPENVRMNKEGYESLSSVMERGLHALSPAAFEAAAAEHSALILDTRDPHIFVNGFIPGSINIGVNGNFAPWAGALIPDLRQPILIIAEPGREKEVITRLARVGYDYTIGYLEGGYVAWVEAGRPVEVIASIPVEEYLPHYKEAGTRLLDVRRRSEYDSEHVEGAENAPLDYINESMLAVDKTKTTYVHCAGGYRSVIFCSILRARGYRNLVNVEGGFKALKDSGKLPVTDYVPPVTML